MTQTKNALLAGGASMPSKERADSFSRYQAR